VGRRKRNTAISSPNELCFTVGDWTLQTKRISKNLKESPSRIRQERKIQKLQKSRFIERIPKNLDKSKQVVITMISGLQANNFTSLIHSNVILL